MDITFRVMGERLKWTSDLTVLCDKSISWRLKRKFHKTTIRPAMS